MITIKLSKEEAEYVKKVLDTNVELNKISDPSFEVRTELRIAEQVLSKLWTANVLYTEQD